MVLIAQVNVCPASPPSWGLGSSGRRPGCLWGSSEPSPTPRSLVTPPKQFGCLGWEKSVYSQEPQRNPIDTYLFLHFTVVGKLLFICVCCFCSFFVAGGHKNTVSLLPGHAFWVPIFQLFNGERCRISKLVEDCGVEDE